MGTVPAAHTSPKAPKERAWDRHGTAQADKGDAILERGGWELFADAHAWYDRSVDEEGNDPPREKGGYKLLHHEIVGGRLLVVWRGVARCYAGARRRARRRRYPRVRPHGRVSAPGTALPRVRRGASGVRGSRRVVDARSQGLSGGEPTRASNVRGPAASLPGTGRSRFDRVEGFTDARTTHPKRSRHRDRASGRHPRRTVDRPPT